MARRSNSSTGSRGATARPLVRAALVHPGGAIEYEIVRSARRRRTLEISLDESGVRVSVPLRTPLREIDEFVRQRLPWIIKHRGAITKPPAPTFETGEAWPFQGRPLTLAVIPYAGRHTTVTADLLELRVEVPARLEGEARRQAVEQALLEWYGARAREALEEGVHRWAHVSPRTPRRTLIRNQRRRWGSCAPDGTLRFNWRLIMLEPALLDYVVVHELAHLEVPHHGPTFWRAMDRAMPDHAARRKRMRDAGRALPPL